MKRVHVICEGQTEETFVNALLCPHLAAFDVSPVAALVGKPGHKGGHVTTARMARDIRLRLMQDKQAWCTTFFDYYGLAPEFVGKAEARLLATFDEKAKTVETALRNQVLAQTDADAIRRFIPYIQMYEFEGLLFSEPQRLAAGLYAKGLEHDLAAIRTAFSTPEEINDSPETAPSKRIIGLLPSYDKPLCGSLAAIEIGLPQIRRECRRFNAWVLRLEHLGAQ